MYVSLYECGNKQQIIEAHKYQYRGGEEKQYQQQQQQNENKFHLTFNFVTYNNQIKNVPA